ncbi:MAG: hypothetical protein ACP5G2_02670 [Candidatus Bipolaricaulaceae bacterium]
MSWLVTAVLLFLCLPAWGQVELSGALGWGGKAVAGRVNPLWVTLYNRGTAARGQLVVAQQVGSGWRGTAQWSLSLPALLAPGGRASFRIPWPVERGVRRVELEFRSGGATLGASQLTVDLVATPLAGAVGPPGQLVLPLEELDDPLLLSPLAELVVNRPDTLPSGVEAALSTWRAYLGGTVVGGETGWQMSWPPAQDLAAAVLRAPAPRPPLALLVLGTTAYLLAIGFALPPLAREGQPARTATLILVSCGLALSIPVLYEPPQPFIAYQWTITAPGATRYSLDLLALAGTQAGQWQGEGRWLACLPAGDGTWAGQDIAWELGPSGWITRVFLELGEARVMWRLADTSQGAAERGQTYRVTAAGALIRAEDGATAPPERMFAPGLLPVWKGVRATLTEGDLVTVAHGVVSRGQERRHWFQLRVEAQ